MRRPNCRHQSNRNSVRWLDSKQTRKHHQGSCKPVRSETAERQQKALRKQQPKHRGGEQLGIRETTVLKTLKGRGTAATSGGEGPCRRPPSKLDEVTSVQNTSHQHAGRKQRLEEGLSGCLQRPCLPARPCANVIHVCGTSG